jgi:hypothetical protein
VSLYFLVAHAILKEHPAGMNANELYAVAKERGLLDDLDRPSANTLRAILHREVSRGSRYFEPLGDGRFRAKGDTYVEPQGSLVRGTPSRHVR